MTLGRAWMREERPEPPFALVAVTVGALAATRFFAIAVSPGESDEAIFSGAVTHFDLFDLSPQAPGFPVWILLGRALLPIFRQPFTALAVASTVLAALLLPALYVWGRRLVGGWAALAGVALAAALPVVFVNGGRAFTDTPATAFFLFALALLASAGAAPGDPTPPIRGASIAAVAAGLAAAAGAGVRPHLVLAFGPLLAYLAWRLARAHRRTALLFILSGAAGTFAWLLWLVAQAGGPGGLVASFRERADFRANAFATGKFGGFFDSFLVRDALSPRRALLLAVLLGAGLAWMAWRRRASLPSFVLFLVPSLWSLWFLHSRETTRYSVPFVLVASLVVGAGIEAFLRKGPLVLAAGLALSASYFVHSWPETRWGATEETPPVQAIAALERYVHPGRDTIVADGIFHAFLRTERWQGRLVAWGYSDSDLVSGSRQANARYIRLADLTDEIGRPDRKDPVWRTWAHGGRVAEALSMNRLLAVAVRDPAPPLFGPGFGVREKEAGQPSFRWAGREAQLIVPGLTGPPAALLSGERDGPPTWLTVTDLQTGTVLVTREVGAGPFDLVIAAPPVYGPLERPRTYRIGCDRPLPLPPLSGATRPAQGCFRFLETTFSFPLDKLWTRRLFGVEAVDLGDPSDAAGDLLGFWDREKVPALGFDMRWTKERASVLYVPHGSFTPTRLVLRCRPPFDEPVAVQVTVGDVPAGTLTVPTGDFGEQRLSLPPAAVAALRGTMPLRIELAMPASSPKSRGKGDDGRALGLGIDWIGLE